MQWLRLYHEARNDAKLEHLSDDEFRVWFRLMCFAGEQNNRGKIENLNKELLAVEVAKGDTDLLVRVIDKLIRLRIVENSNDNITILNWDKRQFESDNVTKRVQKHRETLHKRFSNDGVTPPDTDTDSDTDPEAETEAETKESREGAPPPPAPHQKIVELYNSICKTMPQVRDITEKRKKKIRVIWAEKPDIKIFEVLFKKAMESDFLSGRNGKWDGCGFDWLINYNNAVKVLEGNYDNKKSNRPPPAWSELKEWYEEGESE